MDDLTDPGEPVPAPAATDDGVSPPLIPPAPPPAPANWVQASQQPWKAVMFLAWPVLAQQLLVLIVSLSDGWLGGNYRAVSEVEKVQAHSYRTQASAQLASAALSGLPVPGLVAAEASWQTAERIMARQTAIQSAQTTAMYMAWFLSSTTILVTVGSTALVARFIGAGNRELAVRVTNQSIALAAVIGVIISIAGLATTESFVRLMQLEGDSAVFAADYLQPLYALLVFQVVQVAGISCLIGAGDTRTGLWVMSGVAVLNLPLSWALCLGLDPFPDMGFVGIAMGTALSNMLGGLVILVVLARGRSGLYLSARFWLPDWSLLRRLLRIGVPAAVDSLSLIIGQFWFLSIVNKLGDVASSAHGVAIRWEALGFLSGMAFGTAGMTLVGQNLGAEKPEQAARSAWMAFRMGCLVMTVMGVIFFVLAPLMFLLFFPKPEQQASVDAGVPVLRLIAFAMPALASAIVFTHCLRGAGDTTFPVLFTWVGFLVVRIPLAYWFALPEVSLGSLGTIPGWDLGLFGTWLAMFADLVLRGGLFMWRFAGGKWKTIKV
jgi:putative MATE family efflux protein